MAKRLMTIEVFDDGHLEVNGGAAQKIPAEDLEAVLKEERHKIRKVIPTTIMITEKNPTCGWVFFGGHWYWVCY